MHVCAYDCIYGQKKIGNDREDSDRRQLLAENYSEKSVYF